MDNKALEIVRNYIMGHLDAYKKFENRIIPEEV